MLNYLYFMDFLYFPEDKADYIPGVISLVIFMIGAAVAMYLIIKKSKKDEKKFEDAYLNVDHETNNQSKDK